jgi:hypothetical protein
VTGTPAPKVRGSAARRAKKAALKTRPMDAVRKHQAALDAQIADEAAAEAIIVAADAGRLEALKKTEAKKAQAIARAKSEAAQERVREELRVAARAVQAEAERAAAAAALRAGPGSYGWGRQMVRDGYTPEHASKLSGWSVEELRDAAYNLDRW